ncbi:MAG TPA: dihydroneopterin aldolase [Xanthobacteraceae bacterium]|jgi:dihydroneopterin aldolase|nr:dihydroneopterin aldolase [Xanthobacteraceae bacterium]
MSDQIFVSGLLIHAHHGVMEHEAKVGQRFVLDLELSIELKDAARTDKLIDTVSYSAIVETASRAFTEQSYRLVETAAGAVADALLGGFVRVDSVRVTVRKPHAPIAAIFADVGVTLVRCRAGKVGHEPKRT